MSKLENEAAMTKAELQRVYAWINGEADDEGKLGIDIATELERLFDPGFNDGGDGSNCDDDIGAPQVDDVNDMIHFGLTVDDGAHHFIFLFFLGNGCMEKKK
jgi:hypothetical protein